MELNRFLDRVKRPKDSDNNKANEHMNFALQIAMQLYTPSCVHL